ncbi:MAG: response regulator [Myxococcaceae bacterium]|nr:response regulator [Myxococcaceae bacterium]
MSRTVNILIVDDDRSTQRLLADALTKHGFTVTVERDGEWAVRTFEKKPFDAVLLDILLPALNGYEVARKMRAIPKGKKTPIIMISGVYKNALHQKEAVQKHGAFAFLEKPMKLEALYATLKQALGDRYPEAQAPKPPPPPLDHDDDPDVTGQHHIAADPAVREEMKLVEQETRHAESSTKARPIKGDLSERTFAEVLAEIYRWKATGALLLRREKVKKIVFFRHGVPLSIKSNLPREFLGHIMVSQKMIGEKELEESGRRMKASGRQQGTVLIEMGCISPHNLQYALTLQLQYKLLDVFRWEAGEFVFNPDAEVPAETITLGMTCAQAIHEGIRRSFDEARLRKWQGDVDALYVHPSDSPLDALQDAGLGDEEKQLLLQADGHKTVATLRALDLLPPLETDRLIFAMKCAQMVELKKTPAEGRPKPSIAKLAESQAKPPPLPPGPTGPMGPPPLPAKERNARPSPPVPTHAKGPKLAMPWADAKPARARTVERPVEKPAPPVLEPSTGKGKKAKVTASAEASLLPELSTALSREKLSSDESVLREQLAQRAGELRAMDHFGVLGLKPNASREDVKRAYFVLAKEYHPDKHFSSSSAEVRALAQQIYELISRAHDTLSDPNERERYVQELGSGVKREVGDEVGKILAAEGKFQKGEELMRQRDFHAAHRLFTEAIGLYPDEGEFHAWQGWSRFQLDPRNAGEVTKAMSEIEHAIALNPKVDKSYLFLGYIHKATGRPDKAEKQFEKAIQANPDCTEALRELRLLGKAKH